MGVQVYKTPGVILDKLYQWDCGQTVYLDGVDISLVADLYIGSVYSTGAYIVHPTASNSLIAVSIPNAILQQSDPIALFGLNTGTLATIPIAPRNIPDNYAPTDDSDTYTWALSSAI